MAKPRIQIYADLPKNLHEADEIMTNYGRWAVDRGDKRRCGSVEGRYRPPGGQALEERRSPGESMVVERALRCQRALLGVPDLQRIVLTILYVPKRMPAEQQLRLLKIPPLLSQQRHLAGLRMFWNLFRILEQQALDKDRAVSHYNAPTSQLVSDPGA
jgi:hypothetical protein